MSRPPKSRPPPSSLAQSAVLEHGPLQRLQAADGVEASVEREGGGEVLRVRDAQHRLIFEYRVATGTAVLCATGDLELRAPAGSIRLHARDAVEVQAAEARVKVDEARLEASSVAVVARRARQLIGVLETSAERIIERAKNVYRDVEELSQTRAGRLRLLAQKTLHAHAQRLLLKSDEDVKVKGEKIHLG